MRFCGIAMGGRQVVRRLAVVVLFAIMASFVSATALQVFHAALGGDLSCHSDGAPCPDPSDEDHPCGPTCACACCRVHAAVPDFAVPLTSVWAPAFAEIKLHSHDDLHPKDVRSRIDHPPRA